MPYTANKHNGMKMVGALELQNEVPRERFGCLQLPREAVCSIGFSRLTGPLTLRAVLLDDGRLEWP